jgi:hypothetical protein
LFPLGQLQLFIEDEFTQGSAVAIHVPFVGGHHEAIDRILDLRHLAGEGNARPARTHRMRAPDPKIEAHRLDGMLRERITLEFINPLIDRGS